MNMHLLVRTLGDDPRVDHFEQWYVQSSREHRAEVLAALGTVWDGLFRAMLDPGFPPDFFDALLDEWQEVLDRRIDGYVYVLECESFGAYKIGRARKPFERRRTLQIQLPYPVRTVHVAMSEDYARTERELHEAFADRRLNGEWFALTGDDLAFILWEPEYRYPWGYESVAEALSYYREGPGALAANFASGARGPCGA